MINIATWREVREDRVHLRSVYVEDDLVRQSLELPATVALARDYFVPILGAEAWTRDSDRVDLRAAVVARIRALPDVPGATRPYQDLRAVADDHYRDERDYLDRLTVSVSTRLPRPDREPVAKESEALSAGERQDRYRKRLRAREFSTALWMIKHLGLPVGSMITGDDLRRRIRTAVDNAIDLARENGYGRDDLEDYALDEGDDFPVLLEPGDHAIGLAALDPESGLEKRRHASGVVYKITK